MVGRLVWFCLRRRGPRPANIQSGYPIIEPAFILFSNRPDFVTTSFCDGTHSPKMTICEVGTHTTCSYIPVPYCTVQRPFFLLFYVVARALAYNTPGQPQNTHHFTYATLSSRLSSTMFSLASQVARRCAVPVARSHQLTLRAGFARSVKEGLTATDAWNKSCYSDIDYTISDDAAVYDAVQKFAAYNIGTFGSRLQWGRRCYDDICLLIIVIEQ